MNVPTLRACALALAILVSGAVPRAAAAAAPPFPDSLIARWTKAMTDFHAPGMAVVLVRDTGVVALATLGERDVAAHRPVTTDTRFYIASCTKPFVATAIWSLAEEGRVDLDAPVRRYLPRLRLATAGATDSLTVRDLLAHRPGLSQPAISLASAYTGQLTDERFYRLLARVRPRGRFAYANLHYLILGRVLEAVDRRRWPEVVGRRVTAPCGMTRAALSAHALYDDRDVARPYRFAGGEFVEANHKSDRTLHAAGGMGLSPGDLGRWLRVQLGDGALGGRRVFPAAMMRGMRASAVTLDEGHPLRADQRRIGWTAGWEMRRLGNDTMFVHNGSYTGACAAFAFLPAQNLGVGVLMNVNAPPVGEAVLAEALDWAEGHPSPDISERLARFAQRFDAVPPDTLRGRLTRDPRGYAGRFAEPDWGEIAIASRGGALSAQMGDYPLPLVLSGDDRFVADGEYPGRFELDARGRVSALVMRMDGADSVRFVRR